MDREQQQQEQQMIFRQQQLQKQQQSMEIRQMNAHRYWHSLTITSCKKDMVKISGLYYKNFTIVIYDRNAIGQYYKTTIVVMANYDRS